MAQVPKRPQHEGVELLLLHALPLDGSMWAGQSDLLPQATHAPTLYGLGNNMGEWADAALKLVSGNRIIVVGCSVGGSCALEIAALAPERVAALVLIGTKAHHRPDPVLHAFALETIRRDGLETAWRRFWEPLFFRQAPSRSVDEARMMMLRQSADDVARGVTVFHTRPGRQDVLRSFPRPVIVVSGSDDVAPGPRTSAEQAALASQGRLHVIAGCGHYVPLERPEALNALLSQVIAYVGNA